MIVGVAEIGRVRHHDRSKASVPEGSVIAETDRWQDPAIERYSQGGHRKIRVLPETVAQSPNECQGVQIADNADEGAVLGIAKKLQRKGIVLTAGRAAAIAHHLQTDHAGDIHTFLIRLFREHIASHVSCQERRGFFQGKGHEGDVQVDRGSRGQHLHGPRGFQQYRHSAGVVVRPDRSAYRVVMGSHHIMGRWLVRELERRHHIAYLNALIAVRLPMCRKTKILKLRLEVVGSFFKVVRPADASLADVVRQYGQMILQPLDGFLLIHRLHLHGGRRLAPDVARRPHT